MNSSTRLAVRLGRIPARQLHTYQAAVAPLSPWARCLSSTRAYSSDAAPAPPPLLAQIKGDLKTAMKAKDAPRLAVIKSTLAAVLNASKGDKPVQTNPQVVALLRKTATSVKETAQEFENAGRPEQAEEQMAQVRVIEEYISGSGITELSDEELRSALQKILADLQAQGTPKGSQFPEAMKLLRTKEEEIFKGKETGGMKRIAPLLKELTAAPKAS